MKKNVTNAKIAEILIFIVKKALAWVFSVITRNIGQIRPVLDRRTALDYRFYGSIGRWPMGTLKNSRQEVFGTTIQYVAREGTDMKEPCFIGLFY